MRKASFRLPHNFNPEEERSSSRMYFLCIVMYDTLTLWLSHLDLRHFETSIYFTCFTFIIRGGFTKSFHPPTISIPRCRVGPHISISMQYFLSALKKPRQTNACVDSTTSSSSLKATTQDYYSCQPATCSTLDFQKPPESISLVASGSLK